MVNVIDYSFWRPAPGLLKSKGVVVVCRYLSWLPNAKVIDKAEYDALHVAGVSVILNWESTGRSWRGAYAQGVKDGAEARRQARAIGYPDTWPIIQSIDEGVIATMLGIAEDYQRGFNAGGGCGPQGAYGTTFALDRMFNDGLIRVGWQTNARAWYGNANDCMRALLIQRTSHPILGLPSNQYDYDDVNSSGLTPYPFVGTQRKVVVVEPQINPPLVVPGGVISQATCPTGGGWQLGAEGHVYALFGAPYLGDSRSDLVPGDSWAKIRPWKKGDYTVGGKAGTYTLITTAGRLYCK